MPRRVYLQLAVVATFGVVLSACAGGTPSESPRTTATPESTATEAATATPEETPAQTAEASPEATPAPTEQAHEFSVEAVMSHIPPELRETCAESSAHSAENLIVVECRPPDGSAADVVRYGMVAEPDQLEAAYLDEIDVYGASQDQGECPDDIPSEATYSIEGYEDVGRFACGIVTNGGAHIAWTDERFAMLMVAIRTSTFDMAVLHEWWAGPESGPVEAE